MLCAQYRYDSILTIKLSKYAEKYYFVKENDTVDLRAALLKGLLHADSGGEGDKVQHLC